MTEAQRQLLLDRSRQGDTAALGELLETYRPYLTNMAQTLKPAALQARFSESDVVQDAFVEAFRKIGEFRGITVAEFAAWLQQIVTRTAWRKTRDQLAGKRAPNREKGRVEVTFLAASLTSPSQAAMREESIARMLAAIDRLSEKEQYVVVRRSLYDESHAVIAEQLGMTASAVRQLYVRALRRLREECGGLIS